MLHFLPALPSSPFAFLLQSGKGETGWAGYKGEAIAHLSGFGFESTKREELFPTRPRVLPCSLRRWQALGFHWKAEGLPTLHGMFSAADQKHLSTRQTLLNLPLCPLVLQQAAGPWSSRLCLLRSSPTCLLTPASPTLLLHHSHSSSIAHRPIQHNLCAIS